jgi:hypothetical protein
VSMPSSRPHTPSRSRDIVPTVIFSSISPSNPSSRNRLVTARRSTLWRSRRRLLEPGDDPHSRPSGPVELAFHWRPGLPARSVTCLSRLPRTWSVMPIRRPSWTRCP